jgi:hypothetical protein
MYDASITNMCPIYIFRLLIDRFIDCGMSFLRVVVSSIVTVVVMNPQTNNQRVRSRYARMLKNDRPPRETMIRNDNRYICWMCRNMMKQ